MADPCITALLVTDSVLLAELIGDVGTAVADIRRLVYALRPPSLDELGLVGAIRAHATQHEVPADGPCLQVHLEAPEDLEPLPAAVEVAAYRIVQEALSNVVRHASARTCCIRLTSIDNELQVEIEDDGVGLPAERRLGIGLVSMRERAEELGGSCRIESASRRGTKVLADLPYPMPERR